jgi:glycosyltransferase involved in cell wall biosynthesis
MRIALVTRRFPPQIGGVEKVCFDLATGLTDCGDEVVVYTHNPIGATVTDPDSRFEVRRLRSTGSDFDVAPRLVRELGKGKFDVWHAHNMHSYAPLAVWLSGKRPFVVTTHCSGNAHQHLTGRTAFTTRTHALYRPFARRALQAAASVTSVSRFEAEIVRRDYGVDPVVIPNGVHLEQFRNLKRKQSDGRQVAIVSRLHPYKRVDLAIRAMTQLPAEYRLSVIGDGPQRRELETLISELRLGHRVSIVTGLCGEGLRQSLRDADVTLTLSRQESFSLSVLESLAAGTPVIVAAGQGALVEWAERFPEVVTAVLPTPTALAEAVAADHKRVDNLDLAGYDWPDVIAQMRAIYERAAA